MSLLESAKRVGPQLAELAAEDNRLRRLSDRTWALLLEGGFIRALQPVKWGGGERTLVEFADAIMELSRVSPSAGWVAGVIGVHAWQLALFDERAQRDMWGSDATRMPSSSYNPTGKAEKVASGYRLSGRWSFSSGCDHCCGVILGAVCGSSEIAGNQIPDFRSFLLMPDQYQIDDNWHVAGMKATGSKDILVDEAFVPDYRTQSHLDYAMSLPLPGQKLNEGTLYRLPWSVVFHIALAASVLGAARGFVETWTSLTSERMLSLGGGRAKDDALMQRRLADALWYLEASITQMRADAVELWKMAEARESTTPAARARMRWNMNRGCELVGQAVGDLFHAASGRSTFLDHPLQGRFQDIQAALGHAYLAPDPLARAVGGMLLGASKSQFVL